MIVSEGFGTLYDGQWINDRTFVITIIDSTAHDIIIGESTVDPDATPIRDAVVPADIWNTSSSSILLTITSEVQTGGGGCDSDCQSPTLGIDKKLNRIVENGFTYNGNPVNAELYFTPYPLIKTTTGIYNTAKLKIYDNGGPDNIRHVELAFGLAKGKTINERQASIFWDKHFDGTEFVTVKSPEKARI